MATPSLKGEVDQDYQNPERAIAFTVAVAEGKSYWTGTINFGIEIQPHFLPEPPIGHTQLESGGKEVLLM